MLTGDGTDPTVFSRRQAKLKERHAGRTGNGCGPDLAMVAKKWRSPNAAMALHGPMPPDYREARGQMVTLDDQASHWMPPRVATGESDGKSRLDMLDWQAEHRRPSQSPDQPIAGGSTSSTAGPNSNQPSAKRRLNPIFVEALMRWPIGWTDFGCSETGSILWRQRMRGFVWMLVTARAESESAQATLL